VNLAGNTWWTGRCASAARATTLDDLQRMAAELDAAAPKWSPLPYACTRCRRVSPAEPTDPRYIVLRPVYAAPCAGRLPPGPPIAYLCRVCYALLQARLNPPRPARL
jgi:hypothetical protein